MSKQTAAKAKRRPSPRVEQRRVRLIEQTRALVAHRDIGSLTIRDLAEQCGVAVATLYNHFGSREGVIGAALEADFRGRFEPLVKSTRTLAPADKLNRRITTATQAILGELREYTRSVMFFYFHHTGQPELRAAIHDYAAQDFRHIVEDIHKRGELKPWVNAQTFADDLITQQYALVMKWAQGYIRDRDLRRRMIMSVGASFIGISRGKTQAAFEKLLVGTR